MDVTPVNYDLPTVAAEALQTERVHASMVKTVYASIHWYLHHLDADQREQARDEAQKWVETGEIPLPTTRSHEEQANRQIGHAIVDGGEEALPGAPRHRKSRNETGKANRA